MIYADNAATTQLSNKAFLAMKNYLVNDYGNPSQTYSFGVKAKKAIEQSRKTIAEIINCSPSEIYFTSGGTESNNWVIKQFNSGIITSSIENHAILNSCRNISNVQFLIADKHGIVQYKDIETRGYSLMSVMFANNEIGTIEPVKDLAKFAHSQNIKFHTDAVQAVGHVKIDVKKLNVDFLSASAHKFHGPKGVGFLYINKNNDLPAFIDGGSQEKNKRAGTENVASIVAMAAALKEMNNNLNKNILHLQKIERVFFDTLISSNIDYIKNGHNNHLPGLISISIKGISGEAIMHQLDMMDICISTGSACDSKKTQVSHVIKAINVPAEYARGTVRISFCEKNTVKDAEAVAQAIIKATNFIRNRKHN